MPEPAEGVGIHHSAPRTVWIYSGQRRSIGGLKSFGSNGATHFVPPIPPPVRSLNSSCARLKQLRLGQQVDEGRCDRLGADEDAGVDRRRQPAERVVGPGRVLDNRRSADAAAAAW